jgi:hypothetical protein
MDTGKMARGADEKHLRRLVRRQWRSQLKNILSSLEATPGKHVLSDSDLSQLTIRVSDLPLDEGPLDFEPRFFTPFCQEDFQTSACSLLSDDDYTPWHPPPEDPHEVFYYDRSLASSISSHVRRSMQEYGCPSKWRPAS